jgi:hypothetical protein
VTGNETPRNSFFDRLRREIPHIAQCAIATAIGCWIFVSLSGSQPPPSEKELLYGALIGGVFGAYAVTWLYVPIRYGWRAARSLCLYGNEPDRLLKLRQLKERE